MARNIKVKVAKTKHGTRVQSPMIVHESSIFSFKTVFLMIILLGLIVLTHLELKEQFVLNNIIEPILSGNKSVPEPEKIEVASSTSMGFNQRLQSAIDSVEKVSLIEPPVQTFKPVIIPTPTAQTNVKPIVTASASNVVTKYHTVVSGDILSNIAKKYKVNYKDMAAWNNIAYPYALKLGEKLSVVEPPKTKPVAAKAKPTYHIVKSGDFLAKIAKQYKVNYKDLARWNNIPYPYALKLEQKLLLSEPPKSEEPEPAPAVDKYHIVKSGDFLAKIAKQYKVNYKDLARWNNIPYPYALKLEQKLLLSEPAKSEEPEPAPAVDKYHIVKSGDFLAKIAKQYKLNYNDLARWNNIPYPYALKLEQKLLLSEPAKTEEPKPTVVVSDNDKDGIPDDKDFCPNTTSENIIKGVDNMGCVIQLPAKTEEPEPTMVVSDNDKDGIPDDKDFCPNTTTDEIIKGIDDMGCVIQVEEKQEVEAKSLVSEAAKTETPAEEKIPAVEKYHIVKSGDFLAKIAKQYKVNYKDLARWNNIPYPYALKLEQKLLVSEPPKSEEPEPAPAIDKHHIVKSGDFLAKIAKQYKVNYKDLARWNNIPYPYALKLGQKLLVSEPPKIEEPEPEPTQIIDNDKDGVPDDKDSCLNTTTDEIIKGVDNMGCVIKQEQTSEQTAYHIVKSGDFLAKIAKRYGISYKKIARWNNLPRPYALKLGQKLVLSEPMDKDQDDVPDDKDHCPNTTIEEIGKGVDAMGCPSAAIIPSNEPLYHLVKRGESLFKISRLYKISYKDLASWNKISISYPLKLGQKLLVSKPVDSFLSVDTDEDGINDDKDRCPNNTEEEVITGIDEQGCAIKIDDDFDFSFPSENKKKLSKPVAEAPVFNRKKNLFFHDRLRDGSLGPEMAWIPAGSFKMGDLQGSGDIDEQPVHEVSIKRFASSRYEITFSDYDKFATATRRKKPNDENWGRGIRPVINVNWEDARAYTNWLSRQTGHKYRLPTEAEWEYAARAGTKTKYWWGNNIGSNNATCNKCNSQWGWDAQHMTAPVGSFKPNPFGLYDTVGNIYEWTCSGYGIESKTKKTKYIQYNGKEQVCADRKTKNKFRVIRGGHWLSDPEDSRAAHRFESWLGYRVNFIGFRVVRE